MNIYDMIPGQKYLIGDSTGYDLVECVEQNLIQEGIPVPCVKVKFLDLQRQENILFETPNCGFSTYVEPR